MIKDVVDTKVSLEDQKKIVISTHCTEVNIILGSSICQNFLQMYEEGDISNLQHSQTVMYIEALWQTYWHIILAYATLNIL